MGENIDELVGLIATGVREYKQDKLILSTAGEGVVSNSADIEDHLLYPCTHEGADTRIILPVADMARKGKARIRVTTVDTDVVVLIMLQN